MTERRISIGAAVLVFIGSTLLAVAQDRKETAAASGAGAQAGTEQTAATASETKPVPTSAHSAPATREAGRGTVLDARALRIEGEKRFRTNCGRCHMEPHKFPPRAMATVARHMRVRAMLTEEDVKFILNYMTE